MLPPAAEGEPLAWKGYPPDEEQYESLVRCFLKHAGAVEPGHSPRITNGIVDFTSREESSAILSGGAPHRDHAGWVDPSCTRVGSVSREVTTPVVLQEAPCHVSLRRRAFSMVTVDVPTSYPLDESRSFYSQVIEPLVNLPPDDDHLYAWLDIMFAFCAGKPVVYASHYVPGPRVHAVADAHGVTVRYLPLSTFPQQLLDQGQRFRFMSLTERQWDALMDRLGEPERTQ
jgi:hypothetical protein